MSLINRRLGLLLVAAMAVLAVMAPAASAGWKVVNSSGVAYSGPVTLKLSSATAQFVSSSGALACSGSTASGSITDSGSVDGTPDGTLASLEFSGTRSDGHCWSTISSIPYWDASGTSVPWGFSVANAASGTGAAITVAGAELTTDTGQAWPTPPVYDADNNNLIGGVNGSTVSFANETFVRTTALGNFASFRLGASYTLEGSSGKLTVVQIP